MPSLIWINRRSTRGSDRYRRTRDDMPQVEQRPSMRLTQVKTITAVHD
ncbi:hypothetical protein MUU77_16735 [Pseudoxanthomonas sp. F37]|nr:MULTISPECIES: hypothetical protein [Pseudoxanthomonas]UOV06828.1 hypothetical protein MUU75_09535 [Pseudoxanthomonas mexicana]UOV08443.1 hypothetical protein MUU77_16735 [Pseudoxanthomonas sp. F37]